MAESEFGVAFDFTSKPIRYLCTICKQTFTYRDELIEHKRTEHPGEIKKIVPVPRTKNRRPELATVSLRKTLVQQQQQQQQQQQVQKPPIPPQPPSRQRLANQPPNPAPPPQPQPKFISKGQRKVQFVQHATVSTTTTTASTKTKTTNHVKVQQQQKQPQRQQQLVRSQLVTVNPPNQNHGNHPKPRKMPKLSRPTRPVEVDPLALPNQAEDEEEEEEEEEEQKSKGDDIEIKLEKFFHCPLCRVKFLDLQKLRCHVTSVHPNSQIVRKTGGHPPGVSLSKTNNSSVNGNVQVNVKVKVKEKQKGVNGKKSYNPNINIITLRKAQLTTMAIAPADFVYNNRHNKALIKRKFEPQKRKLREPRRKTPSLLNFFAASPDFTFPLTFDPDEKYFIRSHNLFLIRNLITKNSEGKFHGAGNGLLLCGGKRGNERIEKIMTIWAARFKTGSPSSKYQSLQIIHKDPKLTHLVQQAQIFHQLFISLTMAKGQVKDGPKNLCEPYMDLSRRGRRRRKILDLNVIGKRILAGYYSTITELELDICTVFRSYKPRSSSEIERLPRLLEKIKGVYMAAKTRALTIIEPFILNLPQNLRYGSNIFNGSGNSIGNGTGNGTGNGSGSSSGLGFEGHPGTFLPPEKNDWVIRCVCGTFSEEGFMISCEHCLVWQHGNCVRINPDTVSAESEYYCELCIPRFIDPEIPLVNSPSNQNADDPSGRIRHYTLVREDGFMIRRLDNVYILRDTLNPNPNSTTLGGGGGVGGGEDGRSSVWGNSSSTTGVNYKTAGQLVPNECDIFHVEDLWIEADGSRWIYGFYFYRPEETFIRPGQKFYPNELMISSHRQIIPIDVIHGQCWVLDPQTYCKGRPVGCGGEEHIYICEFRVDKKAWYTNKANKKLLTVCMKPFAFQYFETKLQIQRNFHPYGPPCPEFTFNGNQNGSGSSSNNNTNNNGISGKKDGFKMWSQQGLEKQGRLHNVVEGLERKIPNFISMRTESAISWLLPNNGASKNGTPSKRGRKRKGSTR